MIKQMVAVGLALSGTSGITAEARGSVVSVTPVAHLSRDDTAAYLRGDGLTTPVRYGVDAYRVVYRTTRASGGATTASGLVALPRSRARLLPVVAYEHGTLVLKTDAPSTDGSTRPDRARAMAFAADGYAAVAPDYLGLGEGPGRHPYTHAPTEVSASADLLRAARTLAARDHRSLDGRVLVTGFSQGGQAATGFGKALQAGEVPHFRPAALAAVSGPYDVRGVEAPAGLDGRVAPRNAVFYFAYWLTAMNRIYHLYDRPTEAFQEPYAQVVEGLFDGRHDEQAIASALPADPRRLLTPAFVDWARRPSGALLRAMRESDGTCSWRPRVPVRLYAGSGDVNVPIENARNCGARLRADVIDLGANVDHNASIRVALPEILTWFEQIVPAPQG
ncbi:alpha/beta hydrolase family protein [Actinoallomurus sp. CA-150999]|uniref:alpha/beta hydrolase family protein n=1 Tax=Actinoallomurus sp. CA-150999 TaxID=3239887 RepID=UPI003D913C21